ncbi:MAG: S8 family serine peptidase, partial [Myxococcota bacterium]
MIVMMWMWIWIASLQAEVPVGVYPSCGEVDATEDCPLELEQRWSFISYVPTNARDSIRAAELELGSGNRIDRAWRTTTGRWDVIVAVGDSGVRWAEPDLVNKIFINVGELPLPEGSDTYDADGNGLVNVQDWANDSRVAIDAGDDEADAFLDASDLIYTFSDGVDDDDNGYVDDVAGWDFYKRDNDAFNDWTDSHGTHGTGVMREVGAEADNGGGIGACPNCAILPLRHSDSFVATGDRIAESIIYAADMGAAAIVLATGGFSDSATTAAAVDYAWERGTIVAGVIADENSYHHNYPSTFDRV